MGIDYTSFRLNPSIGVLKKKEEFLQKGDFSDIKGGIV
jgi:hypothetical protein